MKKPALIQLGELLELALDEISDSYEKGEIYDDVGYSSSRVVSHKDAAKDRLYRLSLRMSEEIEESEPVESLGYDPETQGSQGNFRYRKEFWGNLKVFYDTDSYLLEIEFGNTIGKRPEILQKLSEGGTWNEAIDELYHNNSNVKDNVDWERTLGDEALPEADQQDLEQILREIQEDEEVDLGF